MGSQLGRECVWDGCYDAPATGYVYCGIHMYGNRADHVHEWVQVGATRSCKFCDKPAPVPQRDARTIANRLVLQARVAELAAHIRECHKWLARSSEDKYGLSLRRAIRKAFAAVEWSGRETCAHDWRPIGAPYDRPGRKCTKCFATEADERTEAMKGRAERLAVRAAEDCENAASLLGGTFHNDDGDWRACNACLANVIRDAEATAYGDMDHAASVMYVDVQRRLDDLLKAVERLMRPFPTPGEIELVRDAYERATGGDDAG